MTPFLRFLEGPWLIPFCIWTWHGNNRNWTGRLDLHRVVSQNVYQVKDLEAEPVDVRAIP